MSPVIAHLLTAYVPLRLYNGYILGVPDFKPSKLIDYFEDFELLKYNDPYHLKF